MSKWKNEAEAREEIKSLVGEFYKEFKEPVESKENFKPGDRISYASRVYDEKEMQRELLENPIVLSDNDEDKKKKKSEPKKKEEEERKRKEAEGKGYN